jgi:hypothetical protein
VQGCLDNVDDVGLLMLLLLLTTMMMLLMMLMLVVVVVTTMLLLLLLSLLMLLVKQPHRSQSPTCSCNCARISGCLHNHINSRSRCCDRLLRP